MKFTNTIYNFSPITFAEYQIINFKDAEETKFILNAKKLNKLLKEVSDKYDILEIGNKRVLNFTNEYFDTEDYKLYMAYHNGKGNRYLIKNSESESNKKRFLEIKFHSNKGSVSKKKKKSKAGNISNEKNKVFIQENTPYNPETLKLSLKNRYSRIVLVHKQNKEKVTIDLDLTCSNEKGKLKLPHLAIVEVKQEKFSLYSDFIVSLRNKNIQKTSLSKYCIGVALLNKDVKKNKFKSKLLAISKLNDSELNPQHNISA